MRPSGTEPKVKLYVNGVTASRAGTQALLEDMSRAAVELLESKI